jgi:hypothetical protein
MYSLAAIIYCFLSTCLGLQLRRADVWEALSNSAHPAQRRHAEFDDLRDYQRPLWNGHGAESGEAIEMLEGPSQGRALY